MEQFQLFAADHLVWQQQIAENQTNYPELLVNLTILTLTKQQDDLDL